MLHMLLQVIAARFCASIALTSTRMFILGFESRNMPSVGKTLCYQNAYHGLEGLVGTYCAFAHLLYYVYIM